MNIQERLQNIFELVGLYIKEEDFDQELEIDSMQFATLIVEIENEFFIRISNDFDDYSDLKSFRSFSNLINSFFSYNDLEKF